MNYIVSVLHPSNVLLHLSSVVLGRQEHAQTTSRAFLGLVDHTLRPRRPHPSPSSAPTSTTCRIIRGSSLRCRYIRIPLMANRVHIRPPVHWPRHPFFGLNSHPLASSATWTFHGSSLHCRFVRISLIAALVQTRLQVLRPHRPRLSSSTAPWTFMEAARAAGMSDFHGSQLHSDHKSPSSFSWPKRSKP